MSDDNKPVPKPTTSVIKIKKPSFTEKFKSKNAPTISGVGELLTALPIYKIGSMLILPGYIRPKMNTGRPNCASFRCR